MSKFTSVLLLVWRTVSSQSSHHPQEVLLAQSSLYVHKGGLKLDSFHFIYLAVDVLNQTDALYYGPDKIHRIVGLVIIDLGLVIIEIINFYNLAFLGKL